MFNIYIKGKYENEEQLTKGQELPEGAVQFKEGDTIGAAFRLGFLVGLPIVVPMILLGFYRWEQIGKRIEFDTVFVIGMWVSLLVSAVLIYVHEFIHAILFPKEAVKEIWKVPKDNAYFVYCSAQVSKCRFIVLNIAPCIVLGIVPYVVWYIIVPKIDAVWGFWIGVITLYMTVACIGDFANIFNAIRQVPKSAKVFNFGMHSYWIK